MHDKQRSPCKRHSRPPPVALRRGVPTCVLLCPGSSADSSSWGRPGPGGGESACRRLCRQPGHAQLVLPACSLPRWQRGWMVFMRLRTADLNAERVQEARDVGSHVAAAAGTGSSSPATFAPPPPLCPQRLSISERWEGTRCDAEPHRLPCSQAGRPRGVCATQSVALPMLRHCHVAAAAGSLLTIAQLCLHTSNSANLQIVDTVPSPARWTACSWRLPPFATDAAWLPCTERAPTQSSSVPDARQPADGPPGGTSACPATIASSWVSCEACPLLPSVGADVYMTPAARWRCGDSSSHHSRRRLPPLRRHAQPLTQLPRRCFRAAATTSAMASGRDDGAAAAPAKRPKLNGGGWQHFVGPTYCVTGLQLTDHTMRVPLDHTGASAGCAGCWGWAGGCWRAAARAGQRCSALAAAAVCLDARPCVHWPRPHSRAAGRTPGTVDLFFRELVHRNKRDDRGLGYLLFLQGGWVGGEWAEREWAAVGPAAAMPRQPAAAEPAWQRRPTTAARLPAPLPLRPRISAGGPGFEAARPTELGGWVKQAANYFRVLLLVRRRAGGLRSRDCSAPLCAACGVLSASCRSGTQAPRPSPRLFVTLPRPGPLPGAGPARHGALVPCHAGQPGSAGHPRGAGCLPETL